MTLDRFCQLGIEDTVPNHSTFSKARHGRFRESDLFRKLFEQVVLRCMSEGLVKGEGFAVDASLQSADEIEEGQSAIAARILCLKGGELG